MMIEGRNDVIYLLFIAVLVIGAVYLSLHLIISSGVIEPRDEMKIWEWKDVPTPTPALQLYRVRGAGVTCYVLETEAGLAMDCVEE